MFAVAGETNSNQYFHYIKVSKQSINNKQYLNPINCDVSCRFDENIHSMTPLKFLSIVLIFGYSSSYGQVVNSLSADPTGFYYYSLDTLTDIVAIDNQIDKIILRAQPSIINNFPDIINGIVVEKMDNTHKFRVKKLKEGKILIEIKGLNIIRDEVTIIIFTWELKNKHIVPFEERAYKFLYYYQPDTRTYKLKNIKSGIIK